MLDKPPKGGWLGPPGNTGDIEPEATAVPGKRGWKWKATSLTPKQEAKRQRFFKGMREADQRGKQALSTDINSLLVEGLRSALNAAEQGITELTVEEEMGKLHGLLAFYCHLVQLNGEEVHRLAVEHMQTLMERHA